jgi:hypothetical protein
MRKIWAKITGLAMLATLVVPAMVEAAGPAAAPLVIVADTRKFTGWEAWWTNLYNESHLWFAVITVVIIPVVGVLLGVLADIVMSRIGIDLSSRDLAEH